MIRVFYAIVFFSVVFFVSDVYAADVEIGVSIDGEGLGFADQPPVVADERVLVPVRAVFEQLGFDVMWSELSQAIVLSRQSDTVLLMVGEVDFVANGNVYASDVAAQIIGGRTMLPIRAVLESVGYTVVWDEPSHTVQIFTAAPVPDDPPDVISIPERRLTYDEIDAWVANYHARGGIKDFEQEVVRLTNIEREDAGLPPLDLCELLMISARFKAQSMHDLDYFSHTSPIYGAFQNISFEVFEIPVQSIGENLANGHRSPESVVAGWMGSDGHRNNILNERYTRIGVGFFENFWAQKFLG